MEDFQLLFTTMTRQQNMRRRISTFLALALILSIVLPVFGYAPASAAKKEDKEKETELLVEQTINVVLYTDWSYKELLDVTPEKTQEPAASAEPAPSTEVTPSEPTEPVEEEPETEPTAPVEETPEIEPIEEEAPIVEPIVIDDPVPSDETAEAAFVLSSERVSFASGDEGEADEELEALIKQMEALLHEDDDEEEEKKEEIPADQGDIEDNTVPAVDTIDEAEAKAPETATVDEDAIYKITLTGELPEGITAKGYPVTKDIDGLKAICGFNIRLFRENGKRYKAEQRLTVSILAPELEYSIYGGVELAAWNLETLTGKATAASDIRVDRANGTIEADVENLVFLMITATPKIADETNKKPATDDSLLDTDYFTVKFDGEAVKPKKPKLDVAKKLEAPEGFEIVEAYTFKNAGDYESVKLTLKKLPSLAEGQTLALYGINSDNTLFDMAIQPDLQLGDENVLPLPWFAGFALVRIDERVDETTKTVEYDNKTSITFTGVMPLGGTVTLTPIEEAYREGTLFQFAIEITDAYGNAYTPTEPIEVKISAKSLSKALDDGKEILVEAVQASGGLKTVESNIDRKDVLSFTIHSLSSIVISKSEIQTKTGHTIWADEELGVYLTGKMPSGGIVQAIPVKVEIDGQETLAAYDIRIFANQNQRDRGRTWQPAKDKVQVHFYSESFVAGELSVYHLADTISKPEYVGSATADEGWVSFEAESFSVYVVTTILEKTIEASDGNTYKITATYDGATGIPANAALDVKEVEIDDEAYRDYLDRTAAALDVDVQTLVYTKLFDISIVSPTDPTIVYQPAEGTQVSVTVELLEEDAKSVSDLQVVHFGDEADVKLTASTEGTTVTFETDGFSFFSFSGLTLFDRVVNALLGEKTGTLYENDDLILSGRMPALGIVEAKRVDAQVDGEDALVAYDIKIYANAFMKLLGIAWQPTEGAISVTLKSDALAGKESLNVYHIPDGKTEAEFVQTVTVGEDNSITFDASSFSIYSVSDGDAKPRIFYTFHNGSSVVATEYLTSVDEFYDPGITVDYGQTFIGWAFSASETDETKMYKWADLKTLLAAYWDEDGKPVALPGESEPWTDKEPIDVYACFHEAYYMRYMVMDAAGNVGVLKSESVRTDAADKTVTVFCEYSAPGEVFKGWIDSETGTVYQNNDTLTLDRHIDLYVEVEGRNWVVFNANCTGATFTGPQLIYGDIKTKQPADPLRKGYFFMGWNTAPDGTGTSWLTVTYDAEGNPTYSDNKFDLVISGTDTEGNLVYTGNSSTPAEVTSDVSLYAQWKGTDNYYYVVFWKQKPNATGNDPETDYEFAESVQRTGLTGDLVSISEADKEKNYDYYVYNDALSDTEEKEINADGSMTLNVYYDCKTYTLRFIYARSTFEVRYTETYRYQISDSDNDNNPEKFGIVNGTVQRVYWRNGAFRTTNDNNGPVYTGTRYLRSNTNNNYTLGFVNGQMVQLTRNNNNWYYVSDTPLYQITGSVNQFIMTTNNAWSESWSTIQTGVHYVTGENNQWVDVTAEPGIDMQPNFVKGSFEDGTYTYHYFDITHLHYGQNLSEIWPYGNEQIMFNATRSSNNSTLRFTSWGTQVRSPYWLWKNNNNQNKTDTSNLGDLTIKGPYSVLDDMLMNGGKNGNTIVNGTDILAFVFMGRYQGSPTEYHYHICADLLEGETGTQTYRGEAYKEIKTVTAYSTAAPGNQAALAMEGMELVAGPTGSNGGNLSGTEIYYYYKRNVNKVIFVTKDHLASGVAREDREFEVKFGENISGYAEGGSKYYTPFNGDTTKLEDGYFFAGWYANEDCTVPYDFSGKTMPDGNVVVYAKMETYRVRVVLIPGCTDFWFANNQALKFRVDYGETISFSNIKPGVAKRPGYTLVEWYYKDPDGTEHPVDTDHSLPIILSTPGVDMNYQSTADWTNNIYGDNDGEHNTVKGILKLYARWQLDIKEGMVYFMYEVEDGYCIYDSAGDLQTFVPVDADYHAFDTDVRIAAEPTGYVDGVNFVSWQLLTNSGGISGIEYAANSTLRLTETDFAPYIDTVSVVDEDTSEVYSMKVVRLRAKFNSESDKAATITFHGNGGTMNGQEIYTQVVPLNATIDLSVQSASFTRPHYSLIGWATSLDTSASNYRVFDADEEIYVNNDGEENILYALWQADIEIVVEGTHKEEIFNNAEYTNDEYIYSYTLGGVPVAVQEETVTEGGIEYLKVTLTEHNVVVKIKKNDWPAAVGTEKDTYTAADLSEAELAERIILESVPAGLQYNITRVYIPATLTIRDLKLTIRKEVTGGFGDKTKYFTFTLTSVEGMTSGSFDAVIYRSELGTTVSRRVTLGGTNDSFTLKDGDYIEIVGLPKEKEVCITEDNGYYTVNWTLTGGTINSSDGGDIFVTLSDDATLAVTNNYNPLSPSGISFTIAPYVFIGIAGTALAGLLVLGKRRKGEQED